MAENKNELKRKMTENRNAHQQETLRVTADLNSAIADLKANLNSKIVEAMNNMVTQVTVNIGILVAVLTIMETILHYIQ